MPDGLLLDPEDADRLQGRRIYIDAEGYPSTGYHERLHRLLVDVPPGMQVDHFNGNKLDNRRENLVVVTHQQNGQNVRTIKGRYRGVYFDRRRGKFYGQVKRDGKRQSTPYVEDREVAREAVVALRASLGFHGCQYA